MIRWILVALPVIALGLLSSITLSSAHAGETWACNDGFSQVRSSETRPSFEVASIKLSAGCDGGSIYNPVNISPGRLSLRCQSLYTLVYRAYGQMIVGGKINSNYVEILGGPDWIKTGRYDINAKAEGMASAEQMTGPMLQMLLEERFKLRVHKEIRNGAVYEMTVAKKSENLQPSKEGSCTSADLNSYNYSADMIRDMVMKGGSAPKRCGSYTPHNSAQTFSADYYGNSMTDLAYNLRSYVRLPVLDKTGLAGRYDFHLEFAFETGGGGATINGMNLPPATDASADPIGPSIFNALKQRLGLKLTPATGPREVIIIDHAEKPSGNH